MNRLPVLLVQLPVPSNPITNVPLAAGYLKAYAHAAGLLDQIDVAILPRLLADAAGDALLVEAIVAQQPALLGFSLYTWNSERSLGIAERVKKRLPDVVVLVGGPEVQADNDWVLDHQAVDVAVIGEGEQTFVDLVQRALDQWSAGSETTLLPPETLADVPGIVFHDRAGVRVQTVERKALSDLQVVPSPYLLGFLDLPPEGMLMVEVSRWCPYGCSFCLYGRNMGAKLGNRYFPLERLLAEIRWGRERGATQVHFIEANLNLVPVFWPLVNALADLNADGQMALYAELRGEHLTDEVVDALYQAGLRVAEVGLQTANPVALRAAHRRTDLQKWAAGTRRLLSRGVEVYLDVILGLPADDPDGVATTLDFINGEALGPYDIFTLQVLPGTAVRTQASEYGLRFQERPPYYVLGTDRLDYPTLRHLRRELKLGAGLEPDAIEGCPAPRLDALCPREDTIGPITQLWLTDEQPPTPIDQLTAHVDVISQWDSANKCIRSSDILTNAVVMNPSTLFDCYMFVDSPPDLDDLRAWRDSLPYTPGYLDRVAVYLRELPMPEDRRVSPRLWLLVPWSVEIDPTQYADVADVIWMYDMEADSEPPLRGWERAGGAGVWVRDRAATTVDQWRDQAPMLLWHGNVAPSYVSK